MRVKVFAVIHPENGIIYQTIRPEIKQVLHEFDMLQPLPWTEAKRRGFRLEELDLTTKDERQKLP